MIFNPLFLSENGSSQMLAPKSSKLSNNKYLFSDIVKVVMNPVGEQKKIFNEENNVIGNNLGLALHNNETPVKLKLKFLTDNDNEQAKLSLAEILPDEIAQLLINDQADLSNDKAVSYISKDLLKGELQNFVNNLVGAELISNNISNESGLLLSLEDKKSAVNLELAKDSSKKSMGDKIIVQTLVVPEKAKLFSLMGGGNNNPLLKLNATHIGGTDGVMNNPNIELAKPTLSVYSFNYVGENFESLTKNIKSNSGHKHNLSLLSNKSLNSLKTNSIKVPLEKISFIPSELKKEQLDDISSTTEKRGQLTTKTSGLKLFENEQAKTDKQYSINKITIVKKKGNIETNEKLKNKTNTLVKDFKSGLKKIDFNKSMNTSTKQLHLLNKNKILNNVNYLQQNDDEVSNQKINVEKTQVIDSNVKLNNQQSTAKLFELEKIKHSIKNLEKGKASSNSKPQENSVKIFSATKEIKFQNGNKSTILQNIPDVEAKIESKDNSKVSIENKEVIKTERSRSEKVIKSKTSDLKNNESKALNISKENGKVGSRKKIVLADNTKRAVIQQNTEELLKETSKVDTKVDIKLNENKINQVQNLVKENVKVSSSKTDVTDKTAGTVNKQNTEELLKRTNKTDTKIDIKFDENKTNNTQDNIKGVRKVNPNKDEQFEKVIEPAKEQNAKEILHGKANSSQLSETKKTVNNNSEYKTTNVTEKNNKNDVITDETNEKLSKVNSNNNEMKDDFGVKSDKNLRQSEKIIRNLKNSAEPKAHKVIHSDSKVLNQPIPNLNDVEIKSNKANKKVSVKVKSEVKSVSDKSKSKNTISKANVEAENSSKNNNQSFGNDGFNSQRDSSVFNNHLDLKHNNENGFNHLLHKVGISSDGTTIDKQHHVDAQANEKIVKSIEVIKEISKFISKQEKGSLSFDIKPEHLGKMKITLETSDHVMKARIEVENEQAKQLIERNIDKLNQELNKSGVNLNSLNISLGYSRQQKNEKEMVNEKHEEKQSLDQMGETEEEQKQKKKTLGYNTYEYIA